MGCGSSTPAAGGARPVPKKKKGAAKAGALNRVRATTRAELAAGLAHAAARGDGDAAYASKLLGRVGLLAT